MGGKETCGDSTIIIVTVIRVQLSEVYNIEDSFAIRGRLSLIPMIWREPTDETLHEDPRRMR